MAIPPSIVLKLQLFAGALRDQPVKWLIATVSIAVGVGLGFAVHLIHKQALDQFNNGVRQFSGQADLQLLPHSTLLPETSLEQLAALPEVAVASPIIDITVPVQGMDKPLRWLGLDVFTAAAVTPNFIGQSSDETSDDAQQGDIPLLSTNNVFVSPALKEQLPSEQTTLTTLHNNASQQWQVAGTVPAAGAGQPLAVADIAAVQWRLGTLGQISRIDLKLQEGITPASFQQKYSDAFAELGRLETPSEQGTRGASVSQAYRANLSILAMVALLTGGFLTFSTQMLAVAQRSRQWALLAALGARAGTLRMQVLFESACCGLVGGVLGVALGWGLALAVVRYLGVDLGAGYFQTAQNTVNLPLLDSFLFAGFGMAATLLGGLSPALQTGQMALHQRLRAGTEEAGLQFANKAHWAGLLLCAVAAACLFIPPYGNIPVGGYLAVAFGLFGGIAMIGLVVRGIIRPPAQLAQVADLAKSRLASTPNLLAVGLSGVVASFALVVAMHVMIYSFRHSLDNWLTQVLPAPLYVKLNSASIPVFPDSFQQKIADLQGVELVEFWGQQSIVLDPKRPAVELIARPISVEAANQRLPMTGTTIAEPKAGTLPVWVSEPMTDLYGLKAGSTITLQLDQGVRVPTTVMGVWRDYTRQHGAIVLPKTELLKQFNVQFKNTQGAVWPQDNVSVKDTVARIEQAASTTPLAQKIDFAEPGEIRQLSLGIFDRSFAVTYLLEIAAVVIGLFGVGTTFSAMALQRKREFALLGAMGASPNWILKLIAREALIASAVAALVGLIIGLAFAAILIFVVNPQSFHWTMEWFTPWRDLAAMVLVLIAMSSATVTMALRNKLGTQLVEQLKEDWA
ncbi:MAG: FtsX-like permease family protein [Burkholderiales bacterium]|jgi:putative ABC transport system permease protein|uniref:FtsX-like permease family protein n=1 Tax=Limnobacter sp. TaxID=2003368 RepID=UPI0039BC4B94|nr:FtsX-like permease family protein [Burkholderiales bacterium]